MAELSTVAQGKVTGRWGVYTGDGSDPDQRADFQPATGTVTLTPAPSAILAQSETPPTGILPFPIVGTLDANGELKYKQTDGSFIDLWVPASDDPDTNPTGFTWNAAFALKFGQVTLNYGPISFEVPSEGTVNLVTAAPVPSNPGTPITRGERGPAGMNWQGTYDAAADYAVGDAVSYAGSSYVATAPVVGVTPGNTPWALLAAKGDPGTGGGGGGAVDSVNGQTGTVVLDAASVGALPTTQKGAAGGLATLDGTSHIPAAQMPTNPNAYGAATAADLDNVFGIATAAIPSSEKAAANGVATLDSSGKIPQGQLPAVAIMDWLGNVSSQAAMLALTGQRGDWATRTDRGTDWQLIADDPTQLSSWREHVNPASPVSSVAGRTGAVTLAAADITDTTSTGRQLMTAVDGPAARSAIGAGTSSLALGSTSSTAKAGDWKPASTDVTDATTTGRAVLTASTQDAARQAIGEYVIQATDPLPTPSGSSPLLVFRARS